MLAVLIGGERRFRLHPNRRAAPRLPELSHQHALGGGIHTSYTDTTFDNHYKIRSVTLPTLFDPSVTCVLEAVLLEFLDYLFGQGGLDRGDYLKKGAR